MEDIIARVRALGFAFADRIDAWRIGFALEYIEFNELPLAFEILCTYVYDYADSITAPEHQEIISIQSRPGFGLSTGTLEALSEMVVER